MEHTSQRLDIRIRTHMNANTYIGTLMFMISYETIYHVYVQCTHIRQSSMDNINNFKRYMLIDNSQQMYKIIQFTVHRFIKSHDLTD